ncbi:MAG: hypothetical protein WCO69_04415 [Candidatus Omnitrophota bacterium]
MPDVEEDKVKSVHLINIPTKVTGIEDVNAGARALKRLHARPKHHHHIVRKEPVAEPVVQKRHITEKRSKEDDPTDFLGIIAYGIGRTISFISNIIK